MRIVFALLQCDHALAVRGPEAYLQARPLQHSLGSALVRAGHVVDVVLLFPVDATLDDGGVRFRFLAPGRTSRALGSLAEGLGRRRSEYEPAWRAIAAITDAGADVVHFHGTTLHLNLALLAARLRDEVLVVQYHGGGPARHPITRALQRRGFSRADRLLFTSVAQAVPFVAAGVIDREYRLRAALEVSTSMTAPDREESRRRSGLVGDPIFVSAGRLAPEKDPLTVLRGFEIIARSWPESRLYLCYLTDELLPSLRRYVAERPALTEQVRFLGSIARDDMPAVLGSADFFVQASRREVASYAVLEAIAAGAFPVLSRIPAFEAITAGRLGVLFQPGDPEELARGVLARDRGLVAQERGARRAYFEEHLSFSAHARRLEAIYGEAIASRHRSPQA